VKLIVRWAITAIALVVAAAIVPGIYVTENNAWVAVAVMAAVLGLVNAFVRPVLVLLSCPFIIITLGLGLILINALTLAFSSWIAVNWFGVGFRVDGFWPALFGAIVVSIVSFLLSLLLPDDGS
jgi:putative membrane protein